MYIPYRAIGDAIRDHLELALPVDCLVTRSVQAALGGRYERSMVLVMFDGFETYEAGSSMPGTSAREPVYTIGIAVKGDNLDYQDEELDNLIEIIDRALSPAEPGSGYGHGFPPFGMREIDMSNVVSASPKVITDDLGITIALKVKVRVVEEA
jgi:hypothetical protein